MALTEERLHEDEEEKSRREAEIEAMIAAELGVVEEHDVVSMSPLTASDESAKASCESPMEPRTSGSVTVGEKDEWDADGWQTPNEDNLDDGHVRKVAVKEKKKEAEKRRSREEKQHSDSDDDDPLMKAYDAALVSK